MIILEENRIEQLVKKIAKQVELESEKNITAPATPRAARKTKGINIKDYPLSKNRPELIKSATGKGLNDITLENVISGEIKPEDIRINAQVLEYQAQIAEFNGKSQFALNLRRAAEMTRLPDEKVLEIYELLRPRRATKEQLLSTARELEEQFGARLTARLVREAAEVYTERKILKECSEVLG